MVSESHASGFSMVSESHASGFSVGQGTGISGSDLSRSGWVGLVTVVVVSNTTGHVVHVLFSVEAGEGVVATSHSVKGWTEDSVLGLQGIEPSKVFFHFSMVSESHASGFSVGQSTGISGSDLSRSRWVGLVTVVVISNTTGHVVQVFFSITMKLTDSSCSS